MIFLSKLPWVKWFPGGVREDSQDTGGGLGARRGLGLMFLVGTLEGSSVLEV